MSHALTLSNDRRLAIIAGAGATLSIAALVARLADKIPAGAATIIVLIGATIGLRVAFSYAAKSASAPSRARVLTLVSTVGLAISAATMIGTLPHLTKTGGIGTFLTDLVAELWALGILTAVSGQVRTLGWRPFVSALMTGFLAVPALATLLGRPVVAALGPSNLLAIGVWVPITEELCKAIPVVFVIFIALRRSAIRPSALDLMLLGAWTGAGFALYENATYGRGSFQLSTVPVASLIFPTETSGGLFGPSMVHSGHLVFSALIGLGVGLALLYRNRFPRPGLVLLATCFAVVFEHATNNIVAAIPGHNALLGLMVTLTLGGLLCTLLLIGGIGYVLYLERRSIGAVAFRPQEWLRIPEAESLRRGRLFAKAQQASAPLTSPMPEMSV
jgi:RsiW-degrading membrane proteinase PrsW (M82 family)